MSVLGNMYDGDDDDDGDAEDEGDDGNDHNGDVEAQMLFICSLPPKASSSPTQPLRHM